MPSRALFTLLVFLCLGLIDFSLQQSCNSTYPYTFTQTNNTKVSLPLRLKIAMLGTWTANDLLAVRAFTYELNNNPNVLPNVGIDLYTSTSPTGSDALLGSLYYSNTFKAHGIIGGYTSTETRTIQLAAKIYSVPQTSSNSLSYTLSNKGEYPYFMRMIPNDGVQIDGIVALFQKFGWKKAIVVYGDDDYGSGNARLVVAGAAKGITYYPVSIPATATNNSQIADAMTIITQAVTQQDYRIIVYYTQWAAGSLVRVAVNASGFWGPDYVTIFTAPASNVYLGGSVPDYPLNDGAIGFSIAKPQGPVYDGLVNQWNTSANNPYKYPVVTSFSFWYTVDALLNYVYTFDKLLNVLGLPFASITGATYFNALMNNTFTGASGNITFDKNGDRLGNYDIWTYTRYGSTRAATYSPVTGNLTDVAPFVFTGGSQKVPRDSPYKCPACQFGQCVEDKGCVCNDGYAGNLCDVSTSSGSSTSMLAWIIAVVVVMVVGFAIGIIVYRRKRYQLVKEVVDKQRSNITRSDLQMKERIGRGASGEVFKANFRGTEVAVKKIVTSAVDKSVVAEFELEVAIMCGLRHPNIILFMGSCFDVAANEMLLVMEFMTRGSLHDVIHNPKIDLSYDMRLHLACQAAQGMNFLHQSSPPIIHRDLKSHNILLDDKWNARISDFGITKFKDSKQDAKASHEKSIGTIYWSSPETLDGGVVTEKADCYSFGIVLWEIFHRKNPYQGRDPVSVAVEVIRSQLRPPMNPEVPTEMKDLICACWDQNPEKRPSFQEIMTTLRSVSMKNPTYQSMGAATRVEAPTGFVYLVNTEVIGAYSLWEDKPKPMCEAMKLHNGLVRTNLEMYRGYESQYDLHSFMIAFTTLEEAMNFCVATQISLLHVSWPGEMFTNPMCAPVNGSSGNPLWKGLRVKMSINAGTPNCELDPSTGRMLYSGPVVEKSEKILRSGKGAIVVANEIVDEIGKKGPRFVEKISTSKCGEVSTAREAHAAIHRVTIASLAERDTNGNSGASSQAHPHVLVDVEEIAMPESARKKFVEPVAGADVSWIAHFKDIEVKEAVGKGAIGDYSRAYWKSREVVMKVFVNQKLKEDDMLRLLSDASFMSNITHPNILGFHAVCLENNHLSMLSDFMHRGNLKAILADNSIQLPMARRVRICQEIANGMAYLTTLPDPDMQKHDNLKSNNILIGKDWEVKISDYGQSNIKDLARTMTSVGSVAWTAPEILIGEEASTPKIATYSFGIIMWEILTRQIPYTGEHPIRVVTKILTGYRPQIPAGTQPMWAELITECLNGDPEERPTWDTIISKLSAISKAI